MQITPATIALAIVYCSETSVERTHFPYMDIHNDSAVIEHEATTSKIGEDQLLYCNQRGIPTEQAIGLIVNGYAKEVFE